MRSKVTNPQRPRLLLGICCFLGLVLSTKHAASESPIVNVYRGEINGTLFSSLTVDVLHRMFGLPSSTIDIERQQVKQGTDIRYHALGLAFSMHPSGEQAGLRCWRVRIYLAQHWDAKAGTFFLPFPGRISKQVRYDWTPQRLETEFRQWYPKRYSRAQAAALLHEDRETQEAQEMYDGLYLDLTNFHVDFFYTQTPPRLYAMQLTQPETPPPLPR